MANSSVSHLTLKRNLCIVYCGIICLIYAPLCIYAVVKLCKLRKNIILQKRHNSISIYLLTCLSLLLIICLPAIMLSYSNSNIFLNIEPLKWKNYGIYTLYPTIIFSLQSMYIFIWRQLLYYYDIKFTKENVSNKQWTQLINPTFHKINWFSHTSNRTKLSINNSSIFYKIMLLLFILTSISETVWPILYIFYWDNIDSPVIFCGTTVTTLFWFAASIIFFIVLKLKTKTFEDAFYIRSELKYWLFTAAITSLTIIVANLLDYLVFNSSKYHTVLILSHSFLLSTACFVLVCVSSFWVMYKNKVSRQIEVEQKFKINFDDAEFVRSVELVSLSQTEQAIKENICEETTLLDILKQDRLFDEFMLHLMREFSIETILSLIEFSQFQRNIFEFVQTINGFEYDENFIPIDDVWRIKFDFLVYPTSVPNSSIVYAPLRNDEVALCVHLATTNMVMNENIAEDDGTGDYLYDFLYVRNSKRNEENKKDFGTQMQKIEFLMRCHKLYSKYIKIGSELEIHLSVKQRKMFMEKMDEFNVWMNLKDENNENNGQLNMLFQIFNDAMEEMYTLLNYSFVRFKYSWINGDI